MSSIDTFTMKDGRKVTVDFVDFKSIVKVSKSDWKEISKKLKAALDFVNSPQFMINLNKSFGHFPVLVGKTNNTLTPVRGKK